MSLVISKVSRLTQRQRCDGHYRVVCCVPARSSGMTSNLKRTRLPDPVVMKAVGLGRAQDAAIRFGAAHRWHRISILSVTGETVEEYDSTVVVG